jgi:hypothetical protein
MKLNELTAEQKLTFVGLLTDVQKDELIGQLFDEDSYFNPIQDNSDNWIISIEEMEFCTVENFMWVKDLPLIEYIPKQTTNLSENV